MSTTIPTGRTLAYRGELYISRGSAQPGKLTIERADNPRSWRVIDAREARPVPCAGCADPVNHPHTFDCEATI